MTKNDVDSIEKIRRVYNEGFSRYRATEPAGIEVYWLDEAVKPGSNILDLGAGQGRNTLELVRLGHHVTAVDISEVAIEQLLEEAEGITQGSVRAVIGDINAFEWEESYDAVILSQVLHCLGPSHARSLFEQAQSHIAANGCLLIIAYCNGLPQAGSYIPKALDEILELVNEEAWEVASQALLDVQLIGYDICSVLLQRRNAPPAGS
jgi:SAM-dependent methyltransferase